MQKDKNLMSLLFEYALQNDIVHKNYARFVDLPRAAAETSRDTFSEIELAKIEKAAETIPFADCVLILCYTGFRIQEFLTLTPFAYDHAAGTLTGGMKTDAGKNRIVPVHPKIKNYIEKWISKKGEAIICKQDGKPFSVNYFREKCYNAALNQIGGVRKLSPHNCRHTFATLLHNKNVDPLDIQFLMGHANYKMSAKYTHAQIDRLKNAVNLL